MQKIGRGFSSEKPITDIYSLDNRPADVRLLVKAIKWTTGILIFMSFVSEGTGVYLHYKNDTHIPLLPHSKVGLGNILLLTGMALQFVTVIGMMFGFLTVRSGGCPQCAPSPFSLNDDELRFSRETQSGKGASVEFSSSGKL